MEKVRRWDSGACGKVERTDQGYLRCDATITKTGVFPYLQPDGSIRRELRLPDEVFRADSMATFGLAPLTMGHPKARDGKPIMLDAKNTARYQVGTVVGPRRDGDHIAATVQITDADAVEAAEGGKRHLSCGYHCLLERRAGVTAGIDGVPDGLRYDAIQREIQGNHVALVEDGRAGSTVQLRLDSSDGYQVDDEQTNQIETKAADKKNQAKAAEGVRKMDSKITIDGVDFEATPQVAQAVARLVTRRDELAAELAEARSQAETATARADAAEEKLAAEKQARADESDPAKLRAAVDARLKLERAAAPVLGEEIKLDEMTDRDIMSEVVIAVATDKQLAKERVDGCGDEYLQARYDAALETWAELKKPNAGLAAVREAGQQAARTDSADEARKRMIAHHHEIGRKALN